MPWVRGRVDPNPTNPTNPTNPNPGPNPNPSPNPYPYPYPTPNQVGPETACVLHYESATYAQVVVVVVVVVVAVVVVHYESATYYLRAGRYARYPSSYSSSNSYASTSNDRTTQQ